ncbi:hypothetical protein SAY86_011622 [Trapa natans]|uniref:NAC domain-containing protein n=1 Tax=Trapa natans TaxID=22666 RepID=A0AAN7R0V0_TRANT|nr:hypothetical protein SAY86_011622 [Trapa natans]
MTWPSELEGDGRIQIVSQNLGNLGANFRSMTCPSCGHNVELQNQTGIIHNLPGLPAGVKFDPNDQEILQHLEAKVMADAWKLHPLIDEFIPTLEGENGICYTHPEKLPGVSKDGQVRHFFHRPSKAYTTGTRKRRKVHNEEDGNDTRWHKTGKTRAVVINGTVKGFKKIMVLYTNYGRQKKAEKTNWVMHQYHLGDREEEKDGEMVVSKIFHQTQPRQCGSANKDEVDDNRKPIRGQRDTIRDSYDSTASTIIAGYFRNQAYQNIPFDGHGQTQLVPDIVVHGNGASSFLRFSSTDVGKENIS